MTHADRARIKRQMSIGEHPGENDLSANEFSVKTYVHVNGEKYRVTGGDGQFCTWAAGGAIYRETLEKLREAVIVALAEKPEAVYSSEPVAWTGAAILARQQAVPVPGSIAWVGIDWGVSPYMSASRLYNERQNDLYRRLMEVAATRSYLPMSDKPLLPPDAKTKPPPVERTRSDGESVVANGGLWFEQFVRKYYGPLHAS